MKGTLRGINLLKDADKCAVQLIGRILRQMDDSTAMQGFFTTLETPFTIKDVGISDGGCLKSEVIDPLARRHHEYGVIYGVVKTKNMQRCHDIKLRFCDFDTARPKDEGSRMGIG